MEFAIGIITFSTAMAIGWTWAIRQRNKERIMRQDYQKKFSDSEHENKQLWQYIYTHRIKIGKSHGKEKGK